MWVYDVFRNAKQIEFRNCKILLGHARFQLGHILRVIYELEC